MSVYSFSLSLEVNITPQMLLFCSQNWYAYSLCWDWMRVLPGQALCGGRIKVTALCMLSKCSTSTWEGQESPGTGWFKQCNRKLFHHHPEVHKSEAGLSEGFLLRIRRKNLFHALAISWILSHSLRKCKDVPLFLLLFFTLLFLIFPSFSSSPLLLGKVSSCSPG